MRIIWSKVQGKYIDADDLSIWSNLVEWLDEVEERHEKWVKKNS